LAALLSVGGSRGISSTAAETSVRISLRHRSKIVPVSEEAEGVPQSTNEIIAEQIDNDDNDNDDDELWDNWDDELGEFTSAQAKNSEEEKTNQKQTRKKISVAAAAAAAAVSAATRARIWGEVYGLGIGIFCMAFCMQLPSRLVSFSELLFWRSIAALL
jgi:hypothetical protein